MRHDLANLSHFSSFLCLGLLSVHGNLHSETTGKVLCLIICCAVECTADNQ